MRVLIAYSSKGGNTKKIAETIQSYHDKWELLNIADKEMMEQVNLEAYDLMFVGGWVDKGIYNPECVEFCKTIKDKTIAFFFTLGAYPTGKHAHDCVNNITNLFEENNNHVLNHFHCQGAVDAKLIAWMKSLPKEHGHAPDEHRVKRWENAAKHPNQEDFDAALSFVDLTMKSYMRQKEKE